MEIILPADLRKQIEQKLANGRYHSVDDRIEQAVRHFSMRVSVLSGSSMRSEDRAGG